jgi:hypothetical protein
MPLIVCFWLFAIITIFRNTIYNWTTRKFPSLLVGNIEIDEGLDNYFRTLDDHDRNWSIKEEENCRNVLNMKILHDDTLTKLRTTKMEKSHMIGVHTYDILANPLYLDDF